MQRLLAGNAAIEHQTFEGKNNLHNMLQNAYSERLDIRLV